MEKRQEISAKPNAASRHDVERVTKRVEALDVDFHYAVDKAGLSRPTGFRLLKGEGSMASLRKLDEWAASEELRLKRKPSISGEQEGGTGQVLRGA